AATRAMCMIFHIQFLHLAATRALCMIFHIQFLHLAATRALCMIFHIQFQHLAATIMFWTIFHTPHTGLGGWRTGRSLSSNFLDWMNEIVTAHTLKEGDTPSSACIYRQFQ